MAVPGAAARPSRRFFLVSGAVLVASVAITLLITGGLLGNAKDPDPPDVWEREGTQDDLRLAPDSEPLTGWFLESRNDDGPPWLGVPGGPILVLVIEGRQRPSMYREFVDNRIHKDPMKWWRERGDRTLRRWGEPVDTASGRWWRFTTRYPITAAPPRRTPR